MTTSSTLSRNFPTVRCLTAPLRWVLRARQRRRTAAAVLLAMIIAPALWWSIQLLGLPDIGDPFDLDAFRATTIPDDRNAFVLYRQAAERSKDLIIPDESLHESIDARNRWSKGGPAAIHRWLEANREAMELFRRGADRPDAFDPAVIREPHGYSRMMSRFVTFRDLTLLEASRLEEEGDMDGAWTWYRTALRATYHLGRRGTVHERSFAQGTQRVIRDRLVAWAADPRTTRAMLRRALDDAIACEALMPSESFTLKATYLWFKDDPYGRSHPGRESLLQKLRKVSVGSADYLLLDRDLIGTIVDAWRSWRREEERSRRVIRLAIANWLAYEERPAGRRPAPDPGVAGRFAFYRFGPEAPAGARALSPAALDRWLSTTTDAQELLSNWNLRAIHRGERVGHRALILMLASQLYYRDHGSFPTQDEALVGPYLKALPDDGIGEERSR